MKVSNNLLIAVTVIFCITLLCVVGLVLAGRPVDSVTYLLAAVLLPTVTTLIMGKKQSEENAAVKDSVASVKKIVNGNTSRMLSILEEKGVDTDTIVATLQEAGWSDEAPEPVGAAEARRH